MGPHQPTSGPTRTAAAGLGSQCIDENSACSVAPSKVHGMGEEGGGGEPVGAPRGSRPSPVFTSRSRYVAGDLALAGEGGAQRRAGA